MVGESSIIWNPHSAGYFDNPYEHLKECRDHNPVHEVLNGAWIFLRHKHVSDILSSNDYTVSELSEFLKEKEPYVFKKSGACPFLSKGTKMWTMYLNDQAHKDARVVMGKSLNIKNLDVAMDEAVAHVNRKYHNQPGFDLVTYCAEFIFLVLKQVLSIHDVIDFNKIKEYSNMLARSQDLYVPKQVYLQINEWMLWGKDIFEESDFQKNLIRISEESNLSYTADEIYSITSLALMAAFETSKDNLTVALNEIMDDPELVEYVLTCEKKELNLLIEELFRFSSPLQYTIRINKKPLEIEGRHIPANSKLYLSLASANRDEAVFEKPNRIIVDRSPNEHLSFGKGMHFCLGATIARMELRHCLKPMVRFLKGYEMAGNVKWSKQIFMRTVESATMRTRSK